MTYLFIDTSMECLTVSLLKDGEVLAVSTSTRKNEHSKYALAEMSKVFFEASMTPNEVDKIIVVNGPGSFTGVRIAVTIAKTFAWSLKKAVIPVSSLLVNALAYNDHDYYVSVINARRNHVYATIYDKNHQCILKEQYMSIYALDSAIETLNGSYIIVGDIDILDKKSNPIKLDIKKVVSFCKDNESVEPHLLTPNYLKMVEAEEKLMGLKND